MSKVTCLLRTQRLKMGLFQKDLAALIPRTGDNRVSRVERNLSSPNAREILAYRLIFGILPDELFPGLVSEVEEVVLANAYLEHQKLEGLTSKRATNKRAFLEAILARAVDRVRNQGV